MASTQSRAVERMYRTWTQDRRDPPPEPEPRETDDHWGDLTAEPRGVDYTEVEHGLRLAPKALSFEGTALLCLHGGGFVSGSVFTHRKLYGHLAKAVGVPALIAHQRHTPEHPYPAQQEDALAAYAWLVGQGFDRVVLVGDSAGGGLAVTTTLAAPPALPAPVALLLISPWVDMAVSGESFATNAARDGFFYREVVEGLAAMYLAGRDPRDPAINPLYADLAGLPPMYIQVGADETLLDESRMLEKQARDFGVEVRRDVFPEQQHTFQMAAGRAPEADDAIARFASWVRPRLER
ncbi:alpha/beta hydrolase [Asanoa sp. WMMD1127]|uniref:alpha/beta hydrolase n=1 Tax=Asanoa sp. WMMD1127 TaxID=3016107 RepID=UPI002415E0F8|nr:alpha/beta hydrolase [Asanoa sp. WMMD1127]MDG4824778.1 alpha/beta hydrolase [Asanoa sp. WMMD1127]